eukprot:1465320-Pyramimonas_sp.AAC.1
MPHHTLGHLEHRGNVLETGLQQLRLDSHEVRILRYRLDIHLSGRAASWVTRSIIVNRLCRLGRPLPRDLD